MEPSRAPTAPPGDGLKRNTDCVYFLASPLTCKKGNECEFRHSESVRVNPRDCWFWLNGNCLNPKCSFRHPPLDGLFAIPEAPSGPVLPTSLSAEATRISTAPAPGAINPNKQSALCHFFRKGQCLKGERCSFMHGPRPAGDLVAQQATNGPQPVGNLVAQQVTNGPRPAGSLVAQQATNGPHRVGNAQKLGKVSTSFTGTSQSVSWGLKECATQQNIPKPGAVKPVQVQHSSATSSDKAENVPNNGRHFNRTLSPYPSEYEPPRSQPIVAPVSSNSTQSRSRDHQFQPAEKHHHQNGRDELLGDSSLGFDVLVYGDIGYSDHYNDEDYKIASIRSGRNPSHPLNDFDYKQPDYEPVAGSERGQFNGKGEYDRYSWGHNHHGRDHLRASSERIMDRPSVPKRRAMHRESSPHEMDESDLRHRLLKQRRVNGLRSAVSPDRCDEARRHGDHNVSDRFHGRISGRDRRLYLQENSVTSRLQGRIMLPQRSSPDRPIESRSERSRDNGRHQARLLPMRPLTHQVKSQDGIRRRPNEDNTADGRSSGGRPNTRDNGDPVNFAGPKSLAELKGVKKNSATDQEQPTKSINVPLAAGNQASEDFLPFEGSKSSSSILKRKREDSVPSSGDERSVRGVEVVVASPSMTVTGVQPLISSKSGEEEEGEITATRVEDPMVGTAEEEEEEEGLIQTEGEELFHIGQSSPEGTAHEVDDVTGIQPLISSKSGEEEEGEITATCVEDPMVGTAEEEEEEGLIQTEGEELFHVGQSSAEGTAHEVDDVRPENGIEDQDIENYDMGDEDDDNDYEAVEGAELGAEDEDDAYLDDDTAYQEDEELDDEDDFAKKVAMLFS